MQTLIAYRFVVSLALSLVVGLVGLHVRPFPADNLLLELIQARQPTLYASLNYTYATLWFSTPFLAISGVSAWLYIFVARTGRRRRSFCRSSASWASFFAKTTRRSDASA